MDTESQIGPYRVTGAIGAGGMGEVFRARDARLNRDVAIKVLPKDFVSDADRLRRFEQEAKTLAALNHPNVLTIHDAGVHEGTPYLVSELLEGKTLRQEMNGGALPLRKVTEFALQIALGLAAAHSKGVIHRDLKPENIFVTRDGRVKILDFGLAKLRSPSTVGRESSRALTSDGAESHGSKGDSDQGSTESRPTIRVDADAIINTTQPGMVLGTPAYMSPEQVRGEPADHRADIFAFGTVLYEMLSGTRAFRRNTPVESMNAVLNDAPPELSTTHPNIPLALARIVERCLEKHPDNRFQTAKDLAFAIEAARDKGQSASGGGQSGVSTVSQRRRLLVGIAVLLLAIATGWWFVHQSGKATKQAETSPTASSTAPAADQKSVAVLPFVSMSADKADEYLSDGMTEELLNALTKVPGLRVPGRSSSFAFRGRTEDGIFRKVGEQLRVATVLEGSVRKAGDKLRITVQLINVADGFHLWSETYDGDMKDILSVQSNVAQRVVQALEVKLGGEATRALAAKPTENAEAHRLYLLGRYHFFKSTYAGQSNAMQYFNQALQLDPSYALAYCGLADSYGWMGGGGLLSGKELWAKEKEMAQKALALDPNLADAHLSLGIALASAFDWNGGKKEIKRALELNPKLSLAYDQLAWLQAMFGQFDDAIKNQQKAIELDPLSPMFNSGLSWKLFGARRYDEAMVQARKALELDPSFASAHYVLGRCSVCKEDTANGIAALQKVKSLDPHPSIDAYLAYAYARGGDRTKAEQVLRDLDDLAKQRYISPDSWVILHLGLGQKDKALDWLEKCYEEQDGACWILKFEPLYDPVRSEPRFQALLKKVGLDK